MFPAALADLDQHLPRVGHPAALGEVLVTLLDKHQERLLQLLLLRKQALCDLGEEALGLLVVEIAGDVENDRDVLLEGQSRDPLGVFGADNDVALLVCPRVQQFELLFQSVILPVGVDDEDRETLLEEVLDQHRGGV